MGLSRGKDPAKSQQKVAGAPRLREHEHRGALAGPVRTPERGIRRSWAGQDSDHICSSLALPGRWKKVYLRATNLVKFPEAPNEHRQLVNASLSDSTSPWE